MCRDGDASNKQLHATNCYVNVVTVWQWVINSVRLWTFYKHKSTLRAKLFYALLNYTRDTLCTQLVYADCTLSERSVLTVVDKSVHLARPMGEMRWYLQNANVAELTSRCALSRIRNPRPISIKFYRMVDIADHHLCKFSWWSVKGLRGGG